MKKRINCNIQKKVWKKINNKFIEKDWKKVLNTESVTYKVYKKILWKVNQIVYKNVWNNLRK